MVRHIEIVSILHGFYACFQLVVALLLGGMFLLLGVGMGSVGAGAGEEEMVVIGAFYGTFGVLVAGISAVMSIPGFLAAWSMYTRRSWGRVLGMVVSALACMSFPMGTILGVYTLVVLFDRDVAAAFDQRRG